MENVFGEDVFQFGRRGMGGFLKNSWTNMTFSTSAVERTVVTKRTSFRFAIERSGMLFGKKDVFSSPVESFGAISKNGSLTKDVFLVFRSGEAGRFQKNVSRADGFAGGTKDPGRNKPSR